MSCFRLKIECADLHAHISVLCVCVCIICSSRLPSIMMTLLRDLRKKDDINAVYELKEKLGE